MKRVSCQEGGKEKRRAWTLAEALVMKKHAHESAAHFRQGLRAISGAGDQGRSARGVSPMRRDVVQKAGSRAEGPWRSRSWPAERSCVVLRARPGGILGDFAAVAAARRQTGGGILLTSPWRAVETGSGWPRGLRKVSGFNSWRMKEPRLAEVMPPCDSAHPWSCFASVCRTREDWRAK